MRWQHFWAQDPRDLRVPQDLQVLRARLGHRALLGQSGPPALQDLQGLQGPRERQALSGHRAPLDRKAPQGRQAQLEQLERVADQPTGEGRGTLLLHTRRQHLTRSPLAVRRMLR